MGGPRRTRTARTLRVADQVLRELDEAVSRAFGAHGERVEDPADLVSALKRALANQPPAVDVVTAQHAVSSDAKKGLGCVRDYQPLTAWDDAEHRRRGLD